MRRAWAGVVGLVRAIDLQDAHLYGGLVLGAVGGERIYPGLGLLLAGAAAFWLAIRKVG